MTAYAYLRRSSVSAESPGDASREAQEAAVRALAARHGDDPRILVDWGISGRQGADKRPGYRQLTEAIASGNATAVYSYSLSRLGRSLPELARLIEDCSTRGIPVRLAVDALDTSTASGRLLANVLGSVAAFEADVAGERVRASQAARVARGERLGPDFYPEFQVVLDAFDEAGSLSGAARLLNDRGVKPKTSTRGWWPSSVDTIVKRHRPHRAKPGRGSRSVGRFTLARLLICPTCGARLTGSIDTGYGERTVRYACRMSGARPHPRASILERVILPAIEAEVAKLHAPEEVMTVAEDAKARTALDERRLRIVDLYESSIIDRPQMVERLAKVQADGEALESRTVMLSIPTVDWSWPPATLNQVLSAMFVGITLDPETFQPQPDGFEWTVPEWRAP